MNDKSFDELRDELLPKEIQDHFKLNRGVFDRNTARIEDLENATKEEMKNGTLEKAFMMYVLDFAKEQYRVSNVLMVQNEMSFVGSYILRKKLDQVENTLDKHGIKIEKIERLEKGLRFVDDYINHHPDGDKV